MVRGASVYKSTISSHLLSMIWANLHSHAPFILKTSLGEATLQLNVDSSSYDRDRELNRVESVPLGFVYGIMAVANLYLAPTLKICLIGYNCRGRK